MKNQQETVRTQLADHADAEKKVADADKEHAKALEEAKAEAAKVIEEARHDAEKIAEQLRAHADAELERIKTQGGQQVQLLRQQLIRELRQSLGAESVHRASDMVRDFVSDPAEQSATVGPLPRRVGRDGAVEHGLLRRRHSEAARRQSRSR